MRAIDELHLEYPFLGARQLCKILRREGHPPAGRLHITTLIAKMGIAALYRKPNTSKRHLAHKVYPYLLRHLAIDRANHVWARDITYLPMQRGFIYLAAVMDWATRRALAWRVSNSALVRLALVMPLSANVSVPVRTATPVDQYPESRLGNGLLQASSVMNSRFGPA
jgi:transposase InsO family protein